MPCTRPVGGVTVGEHLVQVAVQLDAGPDADARELGRFGRVG